MEAPEVSVVEAAARGSPDALGELYERYKDDVYGLSLRLSGSAADAWDVAHDVFAGLPEALRTYEEHGRFRAWLLRRTTTTALMKLRRRRVRREVPRTGLFRGSVAPDAVLDRIAVQRAVEALPPGLRAVFVLKVEGLTHTEIGETLGISKGASRARLCRAHAQLRRLIG